ncbi:MAG: DUF4878 domain-containing protein [Chloroflexi bacterium]|nr:DUF4878 domain-containing protein [Chloroflexota bacterium]
MSKRFAFVLVVLLAVPMLLTACGADTPDVAEDFVNAVLEGNADAAAEAACESYQDQARELAAGFSGMNVHDIDLKYDIGKGNNVKEVIVTGAYKFGTGDVVSEVELAASVRERETGELADTRVVVWLEEVDDEWCVTDETQWESAAVREPLADEGEESMPEEGEMAEPAEITDPVPTAEAAE